MAKRRKASGRRARPRSITVSIDLNALDKLYRNRYEVSLDGDTKAGWVKFHDGDTKGGVQIRDGDTKGGRVLPERPRPRPRRKKSRRKR